MGPGSDGDCSCPRHSCGHDLLLSPEMQQFLGGHFHQDWDLEAEDWQGVVDNFAADETSVELYALAHSIDTLRDTCDEDQLKVVMPTQALCAYNPRPKTYQEWLSQIAERLRQHAKATDDRNSE